MQWANIQSQLENLPGTYLRQGTTFEWLQNSYIYGMERFCNAMDGTMAQLTFNNAQWRWLDTWGILFGVERNNNETDEHYRTRITNTVQAYHGTPNAIVAYMADSLGLNATVAENFNDPAWFFTLQSLIPTSEYNSLATQLATVRPAGIPFNPMYVLSGGIVLNTINYLSSAPKVTGAYLGSPTTAFYFSIPSSTNNTRPQLPTTYLSDPTLNPSLAAIAAATPPAVITQNNANPIPGQPVSLGTDAYTNFSFVQGSPAGQITGANDGDKAYDLVQGVLYIFYTITSTWEPVNGAVGAK